MNLFDLFVRIGVKDEASGKIAQIAEGFGSSLKAAASIGVAAISVAASGIAALTTAAIKNYAEYEQLVGGVETLFRESSARVQEYAANAYKTAGISANQYMSTVTSFSASLLQSLGNDTAAAADLADRALRDMSDNANKMGTDMQTIIATYQSLSRGNFAMLDNLKLGYGGTKAEMERLIATAAKLDSSIKANDMSFGNMVKAIGVIQDEMGITGTTALEAATTISGSVASMKAAWQNLVVGVADDTADFDLLINNFVDSVGIAAENVLPRVTTALNGAARLITALLPQVFNALPVLISSVLPQMAEAAVGVVEALVNGISGNSDLLIASAFDVVNILVNGLVDVLPMLVDVGLQLIIALANGFSENADTLIPAIVQCVLLISDAIIQNAPALIIAGAELIAQILVGLVQSAPMIIQWFTVLPQKIADIIKEKGPDMLNAGTDLVNNIMQGFVVAWNSFSMTVKNLINELLGMIHAAISSIPGADELLGKMGFNGPLQISTDFESGKIAQARDSMGMNSKYNITQNIYAKSQSPAEIMLEAKNQFNVARWEIN